MESYYKLLSPITLGGLTLKNRVIFAPTTFGLSHKKYFEKIEEIAKGGTAMIIIGDVPLGKSPFAPALQKKSGFKFYKTLADICHKYDCKICAQLHQSDTNMKGMVKFMPKFFLGKLSQDDLRRLMNTLTSDYITNLPLEKVKKITSSFGDTALLAKKAGFDMIEVHGDRMCGSFSSSIFNKRTDIYGGSIENRMRFALESIEAIKKVLPDMPIDYKLAVRQEDPHYGNAGVLVEELKDFVPALEKAGVTSFHVTLANHSKLEDTIPPFNHPYFNKEGCFLKFADEVRKYTDLPICGVGALSHPGFIETELENGRVDCIAMSRQLIADPNYVNKVMNNEINSINYCCRCNKGCLGGLYAHKGIHCVYEQKKGK